MEAGMKFMLLIQKKRKNIIHANPDCKQKINSQYENEKLNYDRIILNANILAAKNKNNNLLSDKLKSFNRLEDMMTTEALYQNFSNNSTNLIEKYESEMILQLKI